MSQHSVKNGNTRPYKLAAGLSLLVTTTAALCTEVVGAGGSKGLSGYVFFAIAVAATGLAYAHAGRRAALQHIALHQPTEMSEVAVQSPFSTVSPMSPRPHDELDAELAAASRELARLQEILTDAIAVLSHEFNQIAALPQTDARHAELEVHLNGALTALQFEDMSAQLIAHVQRRIAFLRDALAGGEGAVARPVRNESPVAQDKVSPGSVDLF